MSAPMPGPLPPSGAAHGHATVYVVTKLYHKRIALCRVKLRTGQMSKKQRFQFCYARKAAVSR